MQLLFFSHNPITNVYLAQEWVARCFNVGYFPVPEGRTSRESIRKAGPELVL